MKNILKFGLMSAVAAVALAQTPTTIQNWEEDDVLAIASRGALSDSMQGVRKLADDEAGNIFGGIGLPFHYWFFHVDYYGAPRQLRAYYQVNFIDKEETSGYAGIGKLPPSKSNYAQLMVANRSVKGVPLYFKVEKNAGSKETVQLIRYNPNTRQEYYFVNNSPFYQALRQELSGEALKQFADLRRRFFGQ